jgi:phage FluMu protein Com
MICPKCKGLQEVKIHENNRFYIMEKCYTCDGIGEVDWLYVIFKK